MRVRDSERKSLTESEILPDLAEQYKGTRDSISPSRLRGILLAGIEATGCSVEIREVLGYSFASFD
jgi:hypothetical protein